MFSVLFFVMMFVLGIGSGVGMTGTIIGGLLAQFPNLKYWQVVYPTCIIGFMIGLVYMTPVIIKKNTIKSLKIVGKKIK